MKCYDVSYSLVLYSLIYYLFDKGVKLPDLQVIANISNLRVYNLTDIQTGTWTVTVLTNTAVFSASVTARSTLSFTSRFGQDVTYGRYPSSNIVRSKPLRGIFES